MTDASVLTKPSDPDLQADEPKVAHYVDPSKVTAAYVEGTPLQALCGTVFVPSRDPSSLPICDPCAEQRDLILAARRGVN